jgi:Na+/melibiose symporter-like transporter
MAVGFAFATELTHPIQPVLSNGIMLCFSNVAAWMLSFLLLCVLKRTPDDPQQGSKRAILIIAFFCLIAVIATIFTEEELRRLNAF